MQENAKVAEFSQISPMNGIAKASGRVRDLPRAPTPVTPWPAAVEPHPKLGGASVRRTVGSAAKWLEKPMITDNFRELPRPFPQNVCPASECCNPLVGLSRAALGSADDATLAHASSDAKTDVFKQHLYERFNNLLHNQKRAVPLILYLLIFGCLSRQIYDLVVSYARRTVPLPAANASCRVEGFG